MLVRHLLIPLQQSQVHAQRPKSPAEESEIALKAVKNAYAITAAINADSNLRFHATMSWSAIVCEEYVESLHQRRPEALAVLAFFAAMIHQKPAFWGFQAAGAVVGQLNC